MDSGSTQSLTFYDFLDRMRNPTSLDLVRSIKSFIVSFSFYVANPENDGKRVQEFLLTMESAIRDHPLWAGASEEEIDCAVEGLEKYVMTKLFSRTFASSPEDTKIDRDISEKIHLLQNFLRPEHLDIPLVLQNEASWLLAEKELQKINAFKAPREKLLCILNCCRVINNLLLNTSMTENRVLAGADDFLPVLIYANPPQLHSNLKFIQLYRRQAKLVSEVAYYFTNLVSAKSFIADLDSKSLSIDEIEFQESMQAARLASKETQIEPPPSPALDEIAALAGQMDPVPSTRMHDNITGGSNYPFMEADAGELTVGDVERLLSLYKDVVTKYASLCRAVKHLSISKTESPVPVLKENKAELKMPEGRSKNVDHSRGE
ncbi:hypothetical protein L1049_026694 [Liquidambar formosana]|uniref:VPS9 domain-containing protein n=1 Tax=Liquidambar formosana TaxID=63359 RepID=A0AAP0NDS9_LIQFO